MTIGLRVDADLLVTLTLSDDGVGLPANIEIGKTTTLGLRLVHILTQQLGGSVQLAREGGTHFTVTFTDSKPS